MSNTNYQKMYQETSKIFNKVYKGIEKILSFSSSNKTNEIDKNSESYIREQRELIDYQENCLFLG